MKKMIVAVLGLLFYGVQAWSSGPYVYEKNIFVKSVVIDSADGLGRWPARGDSVVFVTLPEAVTSVWIYVSADSLGGSGEVLDNLSISYRPVMGIGRADSLLDSDATGIDWAYLPIYRGPANSAGSVHGTVMKRVGTKGIPLMCGPLSLGSTHPRAIALWVHHVTAKNDANTDDSIKVWLYGDKQ